MSPRSKWNQPERSHYGLKSKNPQPGVTAANAESTKKILKKNTAKTSIEKRCRPFLTFDFNVPLNEKKNAINIHTISK